VGDKQKELLEKIREQLEKRKGMGSMWMPRVEGEKIWGKVLKEGERKIYDRSMKRWLLQTFDGLKVWTPVHTRLIQLFEDYEVKPGDYVMIEFKGKVNIEGYNRPMYDYDLSRISAEEVKKLRSEIESEKTEEEHEETGKFEDEIAEMYEGSSKKEEKTEISAETLEKAKKKTIEILETLGKIPVTEYDRILNEVMGLNIPVDTAIKLLNLEVKDEYVVRIRE